MTLVKKHDGKGKLTRYKGRLVAYGFKQHPGMNFDKTYALLISLAAFRTALSYAAANDLEIVQLDIVGTFLESEINETLYIKFPKGLWREGNKIILDLGEVHRTGVGNRISPAIGRLIRSIYGTRQAAINWYERFDDILRTLGFTRSEIEASVYSRGKLILLIWVDDILLIGSVFYIESARKQLKKKLNIKGMWAIKGGTFFRMTVGSDRSKSSIYLGQGGYVGKVLERFGMRGANRVSTTMESRAKFYKRKPDEEKAYQKLYQELVGSLNYAAVATRANISFTIGLLGRFASALSADHLTGAKRVLRYLKRTKGLELHLGAHQVEITPLSIYADADFAGDRTELKSTSGMVMKDHYGAVVAWKSTKPPISAKSTADAEYIALAMPMEYMSIGNLEKLFHHESNHDPIPVYNDNEACIANVKKGEHQPPNRHVCVRSTWIRDMVRLCEATLTHLLSTQMPADGLRTGLDR